MSATDWSRPHWKPTGRDASLFYFVPGEPPADGLTISRSRHHVDGFPENLQLSSHARADAPDWFASFFARPGMGFDLDRAFGDKANGVRAAEHGSVLRGEFPDPDSLDYLRSTVGVVSALLDQGGLAALDMTSCRWWTPEEWLSRFVDRNEFAVEDHIQILVSDDDRHHPGLWVHSRGMRKFGRSDLQVKHVPGSGGHGNPLVKAAGDVLNSLAGYLCRGAVIEDRHTMAFPGRKGKCSFLLTPDDVGSEECHFGNEVLEVVDLVKGRPANDLRRLLEDIARGGGS
jgi:hypothetical protein